MAEVADIERAVLRELVRIGPCAFDDLALALCECSWNQVFAAGVRGDWRSGIRDDSALRLK